MKLVKQLALTLTLLAAIRAYSATYIVSTTNDSGTGSLRDTIAAATAEETITFATNLSGTTITLTNGQLLVDKSLTIDASALAGGITINGNGLVTSNRVLQITSGATVLLDSLTLTNGRTPNVSSHEAQPGGGILSAGILTLRRCIVSGNSTGNGGDGFGNGGFGGGICSLNTLTLENSTVSGNTTGKGGFGSAGGFGGGIYSLSTLTLLNSTMSGNKTGGGGGSGAGGFGGGIYSSGSSITLQNATVSANTASGSGGGVLQFGGSVNSTNSIIAGNMASTETNFSGTTLTGLNNLTNGNPMLAPLGYYGGPTQTMPPLPGSPAINAGNTSATNSLTDQRGFARVVGGVVDIGAVEGVFNPDFPLLNPVRMGDGTFQFNFTNLTGCSFTVFTSTNVALPFNVWSNLGPAVETPASSGQFQFTDPQATNQPQRYYRVGSP